VGYFSAYRHIAEESPDLVVFLGDYIYEYTYAGSNPDRVIRKHDGPTATDLAGYRNRYALYRTDPDLQALQAAAPCLMTWDDHEVEIDYANEWSERMETTPEAFLRRRAAAYQAYYELMPLRARSMPRDSALRLHDRFRFGDLVTFSLLDGRQYRNKQPCEVPPWRRGHLAPETCPDLFDAKRTMLGVEQEQCLFDGFKRSDAAWNILAQGQLVAQLRQKTKAGEPVTGPMAGMAIPAPGSAFSMPSLQPGCRILSSSAATSIRSGPPTSRPTSTIPLPPRSPRSSSARRSLRIRRLMT
jgi:alkaline phosphatase D